MPAGDHRRVGLGHAELLEQPSTCGSVSRSSQVNSTRFLARKSRTRNVSAEYARADHAQAREIARLTQELPPGDERLKDDVAQVRALVQDAPQRLGRNLKDLAVAPGDGADDRRGAGQLGDVAGELALVVDGDALRLVARESTISTSPDLTMKNLKSRSPTAKSVCPSS